MTIEAPIAPRAAQCSAAALRERFGRLEACRVAGHWRAWAWKLCTVIGERFLRRPPPDIRSASGARLLHLGCGARRFEGWVNADFYRLPQLVTRRAAPDWMLDLTRPFPCAAERWDGVFLEHVNEHLSYRSNVALFEEVLRTLRPGGELRVVVPSLSRYLAWEHLRDEEPKMARYSSLPEALSNLTQNHGHCSVWDAQLLGEVLTAVGFVAIRECSFGQGQNPELLRDGESHRWESIYLEARKPARGSQGSRAI